jgi:hypothetical protein
LREAKSASLRSPARCSARARGAAIEELVTRRKGAAYTTRLNTGAHANIVREGPAIAGPGQSVAIEYAKRTSVLVSWARRLLVRTLSAPPDANALAEANLTGFYQR